MDDRSLFDLLKQGQQDLGVKQEMVMKQSHQRWWNHHWQKENGGIII